MTKRALLIGCETGGLSGVASDVDSMRAALEPLDFEITLCAGVNATRQGILGAYERLIRETNDGDASLVYYSGHGGRAVTAAGEGGIGEAYHPFIVPVDIEASKDGDFRGILGVELSMLLADLTTKTRNATVILDCCHSARMSRGRELTPKAQARDWSVGVAAHLERLKSGGIELRHVESNPDAVRLVACAPAESAYEYTNSRGERRGVLTESLCVALTEAAGHEVPWFSLCERIRDRVVTIVSGQRPEVEGPVERILFDLRTVERAGVLPAIVRHGQLILRGGRIHGVNVGDTFDVTLSDAIAADAGTRVGVASVTAVRGGECDAALDPGSGLAALSAGGRAFPKTTVARRRPVRIVGTDDAAAKLRDVLGTTPLVRPAEDDEPAELLATVVSMGGLLEVKDSSERRMLEAVAADEVGIATTRRNLAALSRASALRELESGTGESTLEQEFDLEWGVVAGGKARPLVPAGEVLYERDRFYVRVTNRSEESLYASVYDVGLAGRICLLSNAEPSGTRIKPGETFILGWKQAAGLQGIELFWPKAAVPRDGPRPEELVVIVSDRPQDLRALEQEGMRGPAAKRGDGREWSGLERMMQQVAYGTSRDATPGAGSDVRYAVERIGFSLAPAPRPPADGLQFRLDERPDPSLRLMAPRAAAPPPSRVAIRLTDLVVHHNRALGSADVRVDAMVLTPGAAGADPSQVFRIETARFPRVRDGDRLSFDNLLVFAGPVSTFVDVALWVSRDTKDSLALSELFTTKLRSDEFKEAATVVAGLAIAAPQVALGVAAVGAAATLTKLAYELLLGAVGKSIGLYRTTLLPHERFGIGRHPPQGLLAAQDFSFGYEVVDLG